MLGHYRVAMVLRPRRPLFWGLDSSMWAGPVAPLARIAAQALKASLLDSLHATTDAAVCASASNGGSGSSQAGTSGAEADADSGAAAGAAAALADCASGSNHSADGAPPSAAPQGGSVHGTAEICTAAEAESECGEAASCGVCLEEEGWVGDQQLVLVQLQPCAHRLCAQCAGALCEGVSARPATCPFCRARLRGFCV